jgi:rhodanese-related sulfurtransferase
MSKITVKELAKKMAEQDNVCLIDVRTPGEYKSVCIQGAKNIPLDELEHAIDELKEEHELHVMCHAGGRSQKAFDLLKSKGITNIIDVEGGMQDWLKASLPVAPGAKKPFPIMQQVLLIAGLLMLTGSLGSVYLHANLIWVSVAVGAGMTFAGATGNCYMTKVLALMPWNKA